MKTRTRLFAFTVVMLFILSMAACSLKDVGDVGNLKLGKFAETKNVSKSSISKSIKTQWGTFKFSEKQVTKIKKLKNVSNLKDKSDIKKNTYTCSKTIGGKKISIAVTYLGSSKYQLAMGGI